MDSSCLKQVVGMGYLFHVALIYSTSDGCTPASSMASSSHCCSCPILCRGCDMKCICCCTITNCVSGTLAPLAFACSSSSRTMIPAPSPSNKAASVFIKRSDAFVVSSVLVSAVSAVNPLHRLGRYGFRVPPASITLHPRTESHGTHRRYCVLSAGCHNVSTFAAASTSGTHSIGDAFRAIQHGCRGYAGRSEPKAVSAQLRWFTALTALTKNRRYHKSVHPFDIKQKRLCTWGRRRNRCS